MSIWVVIKCVDNKECSNVIACDSESLAVSVCNRLNKEIRVDYNHVEFCIEELDVVTGVKS
jgi:hypothetical protein